MRGPVVTVNIFMLISIAMASMALAQPLAKNSQKFPDILSVSVRAHNGNRFDFDVTVSSPYDTSQRYADAFKVMGADGVVYGERKLWHDHGDEQPFTRDLYGVSIKPGIKNVVVQGRDQQYGYGGKTVTVVLPGR